MLAWFDDTLLGTRCTIQRAADGVLRCLPESTELLSGLNGGSFADNACTVPVTLIPTSCQSTDYLRSNGRIYEIAGFAPDTFTQGARGCSSSTIPGGRTAVTLDEVPLTDFVAFTEVPVTVADGVGFIRRDGADGSKALGGLWHVGESQPGLLVDGTRVVPFAHSRTTNDFVTPSCAGATSDGAFIAAAVTPTPAYAEIINFAPPCPRCPPAPTAAVYQEITGTQQTWCDFGTERTVSDGQTVYLLGPNTIPLADFPEVAVEADTRAGVRFNHLVTSGGTPVGPHPVGSLGAVRIEGATNNQQVLFDGGLAGTPDQYLAGPLFADSTCATPVAEGGGSATAGDTVLLFASEQGVVCETLSLSIQEVEAVYTVASGPTLLQSVWLWNGESCLSAGSTGILSLTEVADPLTILTDIPLSAR